MMIDSWIKTYKLKEEYLKSMTLLSRLIYEIPMTLIYHDVHVEEICIHPKISMSSVTNYIYTKQNDEALILLHVHNNNDNNKTNVINKIELHEILNKLMDCYICTDHYYDMVPSHLLKYFTYHEIYDPITIQ